MQNNFEIVNLFELTFIDGSKLWASAHLVNKIMDYNTICISTFKNGLNITIKELLERDKSKICYVAAKFSENKDLVSEFIDFIELESNRKMNELIKAC